MKTELLRHAVALVAVALGTLAGTGGVPVSTGTPGELGPLELTFSDEFPGTELDRTKWDAPAMERQGASRWTPALVSVSDGMLRLGIRKTADETIRYECGAVRTRADYDVNKTLFAQAKGYFEIRCKLPKRIDADYWAAFWLMAGDISSVQQSSRGGTEIDIMETFNFAKGQKHTVSFHWGGYGENHNSFSLDCGTFVPDGEFHTFGLYWDEKQYIAYIDGKEVGRTTMTGEGSKPGRTKSDGPCTRPAYVKVSCEAAPWAGQSHLWEREMPAEDVFLVDYVRVYRKP